jgi:hypothetical protein
MVLTPNLPALPLGEQHGNGYSPVAQGANQLALLCVSLIRNLPGGIVLLMGQRRPP